MAAHAAITLGMLVAVFWVVSPTRVGVPAPDVSLPDRRCPVKTVNPPVGGTETKPRRTVPFQGAKDPALW